MVQFRLNADYQPMGDQPQAIASLVARVNEGHPYQTLLGVTGSGKTFTMANVIERLQRPALVISHNKTLASQLYQEFLAFFPENAVHYFVSYYDYYLPEAYIPQTDTYIEKDASINEVIDRLRHATTQDLLSRTDVIVVASVSCIYGIGSPQEYKNLALTLRRGEQRSRKSLLSTLTALQYERNDIAFLPGSFRTRGDVVDIYPVTGRNVIRISLLGDTVEALHRLTVDASGAVAPQGESLQETALYPAKHFVTPDSKLHVALARIEAELADRVRVLKRENKLLEIERLERRTRYDLEMLRELGYCSGIENYSRHLAFRQEGEPPYALLDFFPKNFITFIDESHMTIPQIRGMWRGDQARKQVLVDFGFRLPSALDNRPLRLEEFEERAGQVLYVSATPGIYERTKSHTPRTNTPLITEQLIRPTGLLDPEVQVHPSEGQMGHLLGEIRARKNRGERSLVLVLTKRLAEELAEYLRGEGIRVEYLHSEIHTLKRPEILHSLRTGAHDALVGVNLLREGLDLPEVSFVGVLDADKEGFLRNETTLIQIIGRAARHVEGKVVLYGDTVTASMQRAMEETERRRAYQAAYNKRHRITPTTITRRIREMPVWLKDEAPPPRKTPHPSPQKLLRSAHNTEEALRTLEKEMRRAARNLEFEYAAELRDLLKEMRK